MPVYEICTNCTASTTTDVWPIWTTSAATTESADTWPYWVSATITTDCTATSATATYTAAWRHWQVIPHGSGIYTARAQAIAPQRSEVELAAERARREELQRKYEKERAARIAAERKAHELLMACLTPAQRREYQEHRRFTVKLRNGNVYQIWKGFQGNVLRVEPDAVKQQGRNPRALERLCVHGYSDTILGGWMPDEDHMLGQKLLLEADEATFRRTANISPYYN